jgi:hypothetical protein
MVFVLVPTTIHFLMRDAIVYKLYIQLCRPSSSFFPPEMTDFVAESALQLNPVSLFCFISVMTLDDDDDGDGDGDDDDDDDDDDDGDGDDDDDDDGDDDDQWAFARNVDGF